MFDFFNNLGADYTNGMASATNNSQGLIHSLIFSLIGSVIGTIIVSSIWNKSLELSTEQIGDTIGTISIVFIGNLIVFAILAFLWVLFIAKIGKKQRETKNERGAEILDEDALYKIQEGLK